MASQTGENSGQLLEDNMKEALTFAKNIYKIVTEPKFVKNYDPEKRHQILIKQYPNFATAYPLVLKFIAKDLKYNEKAFKKFLEKLKTDPGKGIEGFITRQADYAKFLYIEDSKAHGRHWSIKKANEIWNLEYNHMRKFVKKLEKEEKLAKNEFEEEVKENLEKKRKELLDFILTEQKNNPQLLDEIEDNEDNEDNEENKIDNIVDKFTQPPIDESIQYQLITNEFEQIENSEETVSFMINLFTEIRNLRSLLIKKNIAYPHADEHIDQWSIDELKNYVKELKKLNDL